MQHQGVPIPPLGLELAEPLDEQALDARFGNNTKAKFVTIKMFGIGLATSVLIDATLIRLVLLPAVMQLFGLNTWWIPNWLDDRLPLIDVTGAEFEHEQEQMAPHSARA